MMSFKLDKCNILRFSIGRLPRPSSLTNSLVTILKQFPVDKYLGVNLSGDMKWNTHIDKVVAKANGKLGFVRRNLQLATLLATSKSRPIKA